MAERNKLALQPEDVTSATQFIIFIDGIKSDDLGLSSGGFVARRAIRNLYSELIVPEGEMGQQIFL